MNTGDGACSRSTTLRSQSAMEYLMTYGWAILIISVVVGALFSLGVFAAGPKGGSGSCGSMVGFFCSGPQLASNGLLTATIGQIGKGSVTVTGLGCSNSSAMPSSFTPTSLPLQPSQTMSVSFTCNLPVKTMGSTFSGTLWMQYSQNGQSGLTSQIGTINAQVTQTAASGSLVVYTITVDYATNDNVWINGVAIVPSGTTELYQSGNVLTIDGADCSGPVGGWTCGQSCKSYISKQHCQSDNADGCRFWNADFDTAFLFCLGNASHDAGRR